jgi:F-type H+-transporting ATPase subunit b
MPQFDPSTFSTQVFWLFVTFSVLLVVAWKTALPRITEVRNARRNRVDGDLEKAESMKNEAESVLAAYEKALAQATAEAQTIHRQAAQDQTDERTRRQEELARKLSQQAREAEGRIADEKARAVENIRDMTLEVVQEATQRLVGARASDQEAASAIQSTLSERMS